jgi:hypothetical protein
MITRQERHFISTRPREDSLRRNPLAIAAVTVSVAAEWLIGEARLRLVGVASSGKCYHQRGK